MPDDWIKLNAEVKLKEFNLNINETESKKLVSFSISNFDVGSKIGLGFMNIIMSIDDFELNQFKINNEVFNNLL